MSSTPSTSHAVLETYQAAHKRHAQDAVAAQARGEQVGNLRLLTFAAFVGIAIAAWVGGVSMAWSVVPLVAFALLVTRSARIDAQRLDAERARDWFEDGMRRLGTSWPGRGDAGDRFRDPTHPYAEDLDLFGTGSLFERMARTRTGAGAQHLADALLQLPTTIEAVQSRQAAIGELTPALSFRERLARVAAEAHRGTRDQSLRAWVERESTSVPTWVRWCWIFTSLASTVTLVGWLGGPWNAGPAVLAITLQVLVLRRHRAWVVETLQADLAAAAELGMLRRLIATISAEDFQAPLLSTAQSTLRGGAVSPEVALDRFQRRAAYVESLANPFFVPFALLAALPSHLAVSLQRWRLDHGPACIVWSQAVAEVEALASLASYAYEVPDDVVPTLDAAGTAFRAEGLGHPLLDAGCVRNDVALSAEDGPRAWVVSGSNMSGKSTLLRSMGIATVLAHVGAPVRARAMSCTLLRLGASLHIRDVLRDGVSRFQAELIRLRRIYDLSGEAPTLFLLDEILAGTNSHDRRIGATAVVRALLDRGAIGVVTTHDLALTKLGDDARMDNVHFSDHFEGEALVFDYKLRPGVVQHSNALALMRLIGLPVDASEESAARTTDRPGDKSAS